MAEKRGFSCCEGNALDPATYSGIEVDDFMSAFAASDNNEINIIFCRFLKDTFGIKNLFTVLNEKANEELSEIIKNENIKPAFGVRNNVDSSLSWDGFLSKLKERFSLKKQQLRSFQISCREFINNKAGEYPLPDGVTIFIVVRNGIEQYIYHDTFELHLNDEIYVMASSESFDQLESLLCKAPG